MEKFDKNINEKIADDFTLRALDFLKGKMDNKQAENFANEFLDDKEKLAILEDFNDILGKVKNASFEYKEKKLNFSIKNLLKDIYGISLDN